MNIIEDLQQRAKANRDPDYLLNLERQAKARREAQKTGQPIPPSSTPAQPESKVRKRIRRLEKALGVTESFLDCKHQDTQQFTECCMHCWVNIYTTDDEYLRQLEERFDRRVGELEKELGINQPDYW